MQNNQNNSLYIDVQETLSRGVHGGPLFDLNKHTQTFLPSKIQHHFLKTPLCDGASTTVPCDKELDGLTARPICSQTLPQYQSTEVSFSCVQDSMDQLPTFRYKTCRTPRGLGTCSWPSDARLVFNVVYFSFLLYFSGTSQFAESHSGGTDKKNRQIKANKLGRSTKNN